MTEVDEKIQQLNGNQELILFQTEEDVGEMISPIEYKLKRDFTKIHKHAQSTKKNNQNSSSYFLNMPNQYNHGKQIKSVQGKHNKSFHFQEEVTKDVQCNSVKGGAFNQKKIRIPLNSLKNNEINSQNYIKEKDEQSQIFTQTNINASKQNIPSLKKITLWEEFRDKNIQQDTQKQIYVQLSNKKLIPIVYDANVEEELTCGWLLSEAIRKIHQHQEEYQDMEQDISQIVGLSSVKQDLSLDYYLSQFERPLKYIKDRQILTPYYAG